jgi:hypothetical protein
MFDDSACWLVISAVARMNTNGVRKATDSAIATEWLATASSARRRRIAGDTGRRARAAALGAGIAAIGSPLGSAPSGASRG